tara:strand:- start:4302 stop:5207 length:906 start_codon:yes stop_codon:yes gene_type:complete
MGLTHFAILNNLSEKFNFHIIEPNNILKSILRKNLKAKFYSDDSSFTDSFDISLITTPPSIHKEILDSCLKRGDNKIFIEKPFGGHLNNVFRNQEVKSKIYIGYVLRFNPCIKWFKKNINLGEIISVEGRYLSNTIEKKPKGWRNGLYSGVLNEMGSHIIDLVQYILEDTDMTLLSSVKQSVVSDVDDIVEAKLKTKKNVSVLFYFNWVNKNIRKPVFSLQFVLRDGTKYFIDQQQIKIYDSSNQIIKKLSVVDIAASVPYYLRGVDFTEQMLSLIQDQKSLATEKEAVAVNKLMYKILNT